MEAFEANTAGFIGFTFVRMLLGRGVDESVIDNHNECYSPQLKENRFAHPIERTINTTPSYVTSNPDCSNLI